ALKVLGATVRSPITFVDAFAGAGKYSMDFVGEAGKVHKTQPEAIVGIRRVMRNLQSETNPLPSAIESYFEIVKPLFDQGLYPGSPWIGLKCLDPLHDSALCVEMKKREFAQLEASCSGMIRDVTFERADGFAAVQERAGTPNLVALLDPSYEIPQHYAGVVESFMTLHDRDHQHQPVTMTWFPLLRGRKEGLALDMVREIKETQLTPLLDVRLQLEQRDAAEFGMYSSGMLIGNPPARLQASLEESLPVLTRSLVQPLEAAKASAPASSSRPTPLPKASSATASMPSSASRACWSNSALTMTLPTTTGSCGAAVALAAAALSSARSSRPCAMSCSIS
ncbi:Ribosomal RNA large subunit methyltransferase J (23S rRNA (adenine(2030)-N6)-methyltransferase) (23S rRNA m6A2030 methyltransferase), partial [Durusdinium trenchii]